VIHFLPTLSFLPHTIHHCPPPSVDAAARFRRVTAPPLVKGCGRPPCATTPPTATSQPATARHVRHRPQHPPRHRQQRRPSNTIWAPTKRDAMRKAGVAKGRHEGEGQSRTTTPTAGRAGTKTRGNTRGRRIPAASTRGSVQPTRCPFQPRLFSQRRGGVNLTRRLVHSPSPLSCSDDDGAV
jgi:hypothetical protein